MSVAKEQLNQKQNSRRADGKKKRPMTPFATFHPTVQEREALKEDAPSLEDAIGVISTFVEDQCSLSLGYKPENQVYYAMIRDKAANWQDAAALSYWHTSPEKAIIGLAFALQNRYASFPNMQAGMAQFTDEW